MIRTRVPESLTSKRTLPPTRGSTVMAITRAGRGHIHSANDSGSSHWSNTTSGAAGMTRCTRAIGASFIVHAASGAARRQRVRTCRPEVRLLVDPLLGHRQSVRPQGKPVLAAAHKGWTNAGDILELPGSYMR